MEKEELLNRVKGLIPNGCFESLKTIRKHSNYEKLNIYEMDFRYDYDFNHLTPVGVYDTQVLMMNIFKEVAPNIKIEYKAPNYGCSAFQLPKSSNDGYLFGRNYDFAFDTSVMIIHNYPKNGYRSVCHSALNNVGGDDPFKSIEAFIATLTSPFICIDGINEKGVGIAVLTLDTPPTMQKNNKPVLGTTLLIRLVLDKASNVSEAIELIKQYDVYGISGRDYHFFICDKSGDSKIVEFDINDKRDLVVSDTKYATNFFIKYKDLVLPNQKNGLYGHGRERYDKIENVFIENKYQGDNDVAWEALVAASQLPNPNNVTSNTQWSIVYDLNNLSYEFVLHRHFEDKFAFKL